MPLDSQHLCVVIKVLLEWGPEMRRTVAERVGERLPSLTPDEIAALEAEARSIQGDAFALADRAYHGEGFDQYSGREELGRRFPHIDGATLDHLWSKGGYYAWHG